MEKELPININKDNIPSKFHELIDASEEDFSDIALDIEDDLVPEDIPVFSQFYYWVQDSYNKWCVIKRISSLKCPETMQFLHSIARKEEPDENRHFAIRCLIDLGDIEWIPTSKRKLASDFYESLLLYKDYVDGKLVFEEACVIAASKIKDEGDYWHELSKSLQDDKWIYDLAISFMDIDELQEEKRIAVSIGNFRRAEIATNRQNRLLSKEEEQENIQADVKEYIGNLKKSYERTQYEQNIDSRFRKLFDIAEDQMYLILYDISKSLTPAGIPEFSKCYYIPRRLVNKWQIMFTIVKIKCQETNNFLLSIANGKENSMLRHCAIEYLIDKRQSCWMPTSKKLLSTDFYKSLLLYKEYVDSDMATEDLKIKALSNLKKKDDYWHNLSRYADSDEKYGYE